MQHRKFLFALILSGLHAVVSSSQGSSQEQVRQNGACPWRPNMQLFCSTTGFQCTNSLCIHRTLYCNGFDDCGDNSDEADCDVVSDCTRRDTENYRSTVYNTNLRKCPGSGKCVQPAWFCDGIEDCPGGTDEYLCDKLESPLVRAIYWLYNQKNSRSTTQMWGSYVDKSAVALYLASDVKGDIWKMTRKELAYEASIELLSKLSWKKLQDIPSTELASFVNAFLVTCLDPRNFYGLDIVRELRSRIALTNRSDPYVLLSLCNAGETITDLDKTRLVETFRNKKRTFWTDTQALIIMALSCASKQLFIDVNWKDTLRELTLELKQRQYRNGTVENLHTTALVMQALLASEPNADPDNFDERKALQQILAMQEKDGSFGSLMNTYYVLPLLNCKSLVDVSSQHCERNTRDETSSVREMANRSGPKIHVHYSVWIGNGKDLERTITVTVPQNLSLYGVIEMAAEIDPRFRSEYTVKDRKPYMNAVYGLQNDPEGGNFWFLYTVQDGNQSLSEDSPADIIPKANEHFVMWYRSEP